MSLRRRHLLSVSNKPNVNDDKNYFSITALENGLTVSFSSSGLEYSINNGVWISLGSGTKTSTVDVGRKISFRGSLTPNSSSGIGKFTISKKCSVQGNIMSLLYGDDFEDKNSLVGKNYAFYQLFYNCSKIIDVSNLILPATTLASNCYKNMFQFCSNITTAPSLPATTLAERCYSSMFIGCNSLTEAPVLPATTLANYCYDYMFCNCKSLSHFSELCATNLKEGCYNAMFYGCANLTTAPVLPATTLANYCYQEMFSNCTSLITSPVLPATTLTWSCYNQMFYGCKSLSKIIMIATNISAGKCLYYWVGSVASSGTFVKNSSMTSLPSGSDGIPNGWVVENYKN